MKLKILIITISILKTSYIFSQSIYNDRQTIGKKEAIAFVNESTKNAKRNLVKYQDKKILTDSSTAIKIAETILFKTIGEDEIKKQRPYEVYFISNYWYIRGTKIKTEPGTTLGGGQFNIIIDSYDSKILLLSEDE